MTDLAPRYGRQAPSPIAGNDLDRSKDFKAAARHTRRVHLLRVALPVVSGLILVVFLSSIVMQAGWHRDVAKVVLPRILPSDLTMHNPNYSGYGDDGSSYSFAAKTAKPDLKNTDIIYLNEITGQLVDANKSITHFAATKGVYNFKTGILELEEAISFDSADGLKARLTQATVNSKVASIVSNKPVEVAFPAGTINSTKLSIRYKAKVVNFLHNVRANLKPPPPQKPAVEEGQHKADTPAGLFAASGQPVTVTSRTFTIYDNEKRGVFNDDVVAKQGAATMTTPELEVTYESGEANKGKAGAGAAHDQGAIAAVSGGKIRRIIAKGPVVMTPNQTDRVTSNAAEFDSINQTAILTGGVKMASGANRSATSDRVDLDQGKQIAILSGDVVVRQDRNVLRGRRLVVEQAIGRTTLTSPPGLGSGPGRISATFVQDAAKARPNKPDKPDPSRPLGGFRTDPKQPLEVVADQLVVKDKKKQAVFRGGVIAKQGTFTMKAAALTAIYSGSAALGDVTPGQKLGAEASATTLKRIRADKNVVITGDQDQSIEGDWAEFDVAANKAVVGGEVKLKQNGAIIQGTRLTIDTKSGQSMIDTAPANTVSKPAGGGWLTQNADGSVVSAPKTNSGRPSAVFFLNQLEQNRKSKPAKDPVKGTSSWEARTAP